MIVIGIDPHKRAHTAAALERATGELLAERTVKAREQGHGELVLWARALDPERVWALEDCRHVSGALERYRWLDRLQGWLGGRTEVEARIAAELVERVRELTRRVNALERELEDLLEAEAEELLELSGCGTLTAAKLIGEVAGVERFSRESKLAKHTGTAPLDASSGEQRRHRLNRSGNRQLNCALHRIAVTQARIHPPARAYLERKQAEGKSRREALRCLKRHLARVVFNALKERERRKLQERMQETSTAALEPALT